VLLFHTVAMTRAAVVTAKWVDSPVRSNITHHTSAYPIELIVINVLKMHTNHQKYIIRFTYATLLAGLVIRISLLKIDKIHHKVNKSLERPTDWSPIFMIKLWQ